MGGGASQNNGKGGTAASTAEGPRRASTMSVAELNDLIATQNDSDGDDDGDVDVDIVSEMKGDRALEALKADTATVDDLKTNLQVVEEIASKSKFHKAMFRKRNAPVILIKVAREQFAEQPMVAVECFRLLLLVTTGDNSVEAGLASLGVLETALDILNMYLHRDTALAELCCRFLRRMTSTSTDNVVRLGELRCPEAVLAALAAHGTAHAGLAAEALHLVANLAKVGSFPDAAALCNVAPLTAAAPSHCIGHRHHHHRDPAAAPPPPPQDPVSAAKLTDGGVLPALVAALVAHSHVTAVAVAAARCLTNFSADAVNSHRLGEAGACVALVKSLRDNPTSIEATDACVRAVINLSGDAGNRRALVDGGACEALVAAITKYPKSNTIIMGCVQACNNLLDASTKAKFGTLTLKSVLVHVVSPNEASVRTAAALTEPTKQAVARLVNAL